jgi:hypothetical protein
MKENDHMMADIAELIDNDVSLIQQDDSIWSTASDDKEESAEMEEMTRALMKETPAFIVLRRTKLMRLLTDSGKLGFLHTKMMIR